MYDAGCQAFKDRLPQDIPPNEVVDENQQDIWIH
jgi:hypothetical protein